jgi:hypothetical protein
MNLCPFVVRCPVWRDIEFTNVPLVDLTASESDALVHLGVKLR